MDSSVRQFIKDAKDLGYDFSLIEGNFKDPQTLKAKKLWDIQQRKIEGHATFIKNHIDNPILEYADGVFKASKIVGMREFNGRMVFVTNSTALAYEKTLSTQEQLNIKRIVF